MHYLKIEQRYASRVITNFGDKTVTKTYNNKRSLHYVEKEIEWLKKFAEYKWCPRLLNYGRKSITMSYQGEMISKKELPNDWQKQIDGILEGLKKHNCYYCDLRLSHLRLMDGKVSLIDFGQTRPFTELRGWTTEKQKTKFYGILQALENEKEGIKI